MSENQTQDMIDPADAVSYGPVATEAESDDKFGPAALRETIEAMARVMDEFKQDPEKTPEGYQNMFRAMIVERVTTRMKEAGETFDEATKHLYVDPNRIMRILRGTSEPTFAEVCVAVCDAGKREG